MDDTNELAKAVVFAYVALVNRLAKTAVDKDDLIAALSAFSVMLDESGDSQKASQYLRVFATALSGSPDETEKILNSLH